MRKIRLFVCLFFLTVFNFFTVNAEVRLPAIIGSYMVLQQNTEVKIWGWCDPGEKIRIHSGWDTTSYNTTGNPDGKWTLSIKTPEAGGPYPVTISGNNKIVLDDVLIGEVWLCSGQSNMEMSYSWGIKEYANDIDNAHNNKIRLFRVARASAKYPQDDLNGSWVVCNPEDLKTFSLAGYFFGQKLQETLSAPVGLIESAWGGTPAEVWTPKEEIDDNDILKKVADSLKVIPWGPIRSASLYNGMIYPIVNFNIAGVIWYQGEANVDNASTYQPLFSTMITSWRKAWNKNFPFYFVQIASYNYGDNIRGALLKEAQTKTLSVPNTGMIVVDDLVTVVNNIHPRNKKDVGYRLANLALSQTYKKENFPYKYPAYTGIEIGKGKIKIDFTNADNGLMSKGDTIKGFYIAGTDKNFVPALAKIAGNTIVLTNKSIKNPVAVRYDFTNSSVPNLFNKQGLPVILFRTDDWNDVNTTANK